MFSRIALLATLVSACGPESIVAPDAPSKDVCCSFVPDADYVRQCLAPSVEPGTCETFTCFDQPASRLYTVCAPEQP